MQAGFAAVVAIIFALAGADPILTLVPAMLGFGTLSVLILQGLAAISIVVYFRRRQDPRWWSTFISPGIGFLGIAAISVLAVVKLQHRRRIGGARHPSDAPSSSSSP